MTTATTSTDGATPPATLLQLMWLASPALPVGGFSYSEGLEAAVEAGLVTNEAQAADWLSAQLQLALARCDLPALAQAHAAWQLHDAAQVQAVNTWLRCSRESAEFRAQAEQMGRSLLDWLRNGAHAADPRLATLAALPPAPLWPTAFALAAVLAGATPRDTLLAFAWGWAENMAQAAMKAVPLGQAAAQRVLSRLGAELPALLETALVLPAEDRQAYAPMLAILSAQHEAQYSRLFRS
ncbi:MAG: urease accessory UreF family protein [Rubrivivax sp.]|nr:urease accessory UreF family protein [Rubrivivax sp.]